MSICITHHICEHAKHHGKKHLEPDLPTRDIERSTRHRHCKSRPETELLDQPWPEADKRILVQDEIEMVVQVNGKLRGQIRVVKEAERETIEQTALENEQVKKILKEKSR